VRFKRQAHATRNRFAPLQDERYEESALDNHTADMDDEAEKQEDLTSNYMVQDAIGDDQL
jgi:hypothetical protein